MEIYVYIGGLTDRCYIINYLDVFGYSAKPLDKYSFNLIKIFVSRKIVWQTYSPL